MNVEEIILDMLSHGFPLGLATLKASVLEAQKQEVEPALTALVGAGFVMEVKRHRYAKVINGNAK